MTKFHGDHHGKASFVRKHHGIPQTCAQTEVQHFSFTGPRTQSLQLGVVGQNAWNSWEQRTKVKIGPAAAQIHRVNQWTAIGNRSRQPHRHGVVRPTLGGRFDPLGEPLGRQIRTRRKLSSFRISGTQEFDIGPTDINSQDLHDSILLQSRTRYRVTAL